MLDLLCPVCGGRLAREKTVWRCESRHSFDVARSGYVNLLPPSASGKRHGDDKRMVAARTAFLSRGYYDHLIGAVAGSCAQLTGPDACVLDAGCGEGTYTRAIYDALAAKGGCPQLLGADISAEAVRRAARQVPEGIFCAASTAHLPLAAESLDLIVNIFSPLMAEEFLRVLKPGGYLLRVVPMERHLFELKAAVYDTAIRKSARRACGRGLPPAADADAPKDHHAFVKRGCAGAVSHDALLLQDRRGGPAKACRRALASRHDGIPDSRLSKTVIRKAAFPAQGMPL